MSRQGNILKNFFSLTTAETVNRLVSLLYLPYLARIFGPAGFGKVSFAESLVASFMLAANFGFDLVGVREVAKFKEEEGKTFAHILAIELITSLVSFVALCVFVYFLPQPVELKILILLYGFTLIAFGFTIDWFFLGQERMGVVAAVRIARQFSYVGLILLTIHAPEHLYRLPLSYVAADIFAAVIFFYLFFLRHKKLHFKLEFSAIKYLCSEAFPLGMSNLLNASRERIGPVVLGFMRSASEVGFYSAGYKLMCVTNIVPHMLYRAIFPDMAFHLKNKSRDEAVRYIRGVYRAVSLLVFPVIFFIFYNAPFIVRSIFGGNFDDGVFVLQIIIWCTAVLFFSRLYYIYMISMGWQQRLFACTSLGLVLNAALCFYFTRPWGVVGAAAAFLVSEFILGFVYYFACGIKAAPGRELLKGFLCFLPALLICIFLKEKAHSVMISLLAGCVYMAIVPRVYDLRSLLKIHAQEDATIKDPPLFRREDAAPSN